MARAGHAHSVLLVNDGAPAFRPVRQPSRREEIPVTTPSRRRAARIRPAVAAAALALAAVPALAQATSFHGQFGSVTPGGATGPDAPPGTFAEPQGIGVTAGGTLYVADGSNSRVQRFTRDGVFGGSWEVRNHGGGPGNPVDVAVDDDRAWVIEQQWGFLQRYGATGGAPASGTSAIEVGSSAGGVALDDAGHLFSTSYGLAKVRRHDRTGAAWSAAAEWGSPGTATGQLARPVGVAVSPDGQSVYVAERDTDRVQRFGRDGTPLGVIGTPGSAPGQLDDPAGVAVDPRNGDVWVADTGNGRLQRFSAAGAFEEAVAATGGPGTQAFTPRDVAVDGQGYVYTLDVTGPRIIIFADGPAPVTTPPPPPPAPASPAAPATPPPSPARPAAAPVASAPPALVVGAPRTISVAGARVEAPRTVSAAALRTAKCVNVTVRAAKPLSVLVTIYSGRRSLRLFGSATATFAKAGVRTVCVPVPARAKTFRPRDGLTLRIRSARTRVGLSVTGVATRTVPIAVAG